MTGHRMVIEAGPGTIRRICCGAGEYHDGESISAALEFIDDPVALAGGEPIAVAALWVTVLQALACPDRESVLVLYPSWWSAARVELVVEAARTVAGDVTARPRSRPCGDDSTGAAGPARIVVEIADRLVALTDRAGTVAEPRGGPPDRLAETVCRRVMALAAGRPAAIRVDAASGVGGAAVLAGLIADRLATAPIEADVAVADDRWLAVEVGQPVAEPDLAEPDLAEPNRRSRLPVLSATAVLLCVLLLLLVVVVVVVGGGFRAGPSGEPAPAGPVGPVTFLVDGRVALQVPADWPVRRVATGPGSARVEVVSPADPEVMLHLTQAVVPGQTLGTTAETLARAVDRAGVEGSPGVFADFDRSGSRAGRPAVTYRELRRAHQIEWTVLVDGAVRISIGCQSRPDGADVVRAQCDQAVRSARALR